MTDELLIGQHDKFYAIFVYQDCGYEEHDPPAPLVGCSCGSENIELDKEISTLPISWYDRKELKQMAKNHSNEEIEGGGQ